MTENIAAEIPASIVPSIVSMIGPFQTICNYRVQGDRTSVWKVVAERQNFIVKLHHKKRKWHPEVYAFTHWSAAYAPYAPTLVGVLESDELQGIVTTESPGIPMREVEIPDATKAKVYFQAGQLAGNLHRCPPGEWFGIPDRVGHPLQECFIDPVTAMQADFQKWFTKAVSLNCLEIEEVALAEWALKNMHCFAGELPLPINQDYTPGNWLVDPQGKLTGIIDFECMLWGVRVDSFAILWERYFSQNPLYERAFWDGYGIDLWKENPEQACCVCLKIGVGDIALGTEYQNDACIHRGRTLVRRVAESRTARTNF